MLKAALCGNYVNFGAFRLYGDDALDNALGMFVKLLLSVSQSDLLVSTDCYKYFTACVFAALNIIHSNSDWLFSKICFKIFLNFKPFYQSFVGFSPFHLAPHDWYVLSCCTIHPVELPHYLIFGSLRCL